MSTVIVNETVEMNSSSNNGGATESVLTVTAKLVISEVELAKCDCCGLTEECTAAYISRIRERYQGNWICGLCAEAVNYEMRLLNTEEALIQHMSFCNQFKSAVPPPNPAVHLISAMRHILRRSMSSSPRKNGKLNRPAICNPAPPASNLNQNHEMNMSDNERAEL